MQGDIIDAILETKGGRCRVLDPFVGSGTVMTEALMRNLDFTGIDINPLAALVCEAKAAIDVGADVEGGAQTLLAALRLDVCETIDVGFPGREKWFDDASSVKFSVLRRAIMHVRDPGARKVMWTVLRKPFGFARTAARAPTNCTSANQTIELPPKRSLRPLRRTCGKR